LPLLQGTGEGSLADPASAADLSVNFGTDGEVKVSRFFPGVFFAI